MIRKSFFVLLCALLALIVTLPAHSMIRKGEGDKGKTTMVYVFGVSQNLGDTVVYLSSITPVAGAELKGRYELVNRIYYSEQFKNYVETTFGRTHQTTAVVFGTNLKDVEKRFGRMEDKIRKKSPYPPTMKYVRPEDFHFKVPVIVQDKEGNF